MLWDDREERPGVKFKDADLIGLPLRLTVGARGLRHGCVELRERQSGAQWELPLAEAAERTARRVHELQQALLRKAEA